MNYRHIYHAGGFSDVFKHLILITVLETFHQKASPFFFMDTHAGIGRYALLSDEAQKNQEYQFGIANFTPAQGSYPTLVQTYLNIVASIQEKPGELQFYPGSPLIALPWIRDQDRMILTELHPQDLLTLKENMPRHKSIAIHHQDAYFALKAFLPPKEGRGLVLIDPPFERVDEFDVIKQTLQHVMKHWRHGIILIWYPIKSQWTVARFHRQLSEIGIKGLRAECHLSKGLSPTALTACGVTVVNPPWKLDETLAQQVFPVFAKVCKARWQMETF